MNYRSFGNTGLLVSEVGFGAWAIGGPAQVGSVSIGWGKTDDVESSKALLAAYEQGINFFDTADFYGLGHSEKLIGKVFGNSEKIIVATKVGQKPGVKAPIEIDYSKDYILTACESSLKRLNRDQIDYYQLHVAKIEHLKNGECIEAMQMLQQQGKIRYWGISLLTYDPFPEAEFMLTHRLGHGFQLAFNIINQKAISLFTKMNQNGYGIIARMPLQFGLLTGKFTSSSHFDETDHRSFRLTPDIIEAANLMLMNVEPLVKKYGISKASLALSFILSFPEISTTIPGIRTIKQAIENTAPLIQLEENEKQLIIDLYNPHFHSLLNLMQKQG